MVYNLYPAVDANHDFPQEIRQRLAVSLELRHQVIPMTEATRNNLTTAEKWDGRVIVNTTTGNIEKYDLASTSWEPTVDKLYVDSSLVDYVDENVVKVYHGSGGPPAGTSFKDGDIYCQFA